jgi:hypothetical protein
MGEKEKDMVALGGDGDDSGWKRINIKEGRLAGCLIIHPLGRWGL